MFDCGIGCCNLGLLFAGLIVYCLVVVCSLLVWDLVVRLQVAGVPGCYYLAVGFGVCEMWVWVLNLVGRLVVFLLIDCA